MRGRPGLLGALTVGLALTACADGGPEAGPTAPATSAPASTPATPLPATPTQAPPPATPKPVTLAFAGDVHFEGPLRDRLDDPATALSTRSTATLAAADVAVVNLETSVGEGGRPEPGKRFTFQAPPSAFTALAEAGVDVATMANNHAVDYGPAALDSTFDPIDAAPLRVVGLGRNAREAFTPAVVDVDGTVVATLGATLADLDPTADPTGAWAATSTSAGTADAVDPTRLLRAVARADAEADVVVVYLHWGVQGEACPTDDQLELAEALVDRGADVVVGSHAHVVQGGTRLGDGYVAYGLGNYAWYQPSDTGVLTLTVRPAAERPGRATVTRASWEPARIGADGLPRTAGAATRLPAPC
jgi:poly-gamma-glutamate capsule biosynthesis protein CapA/YwtB (metallophosphatase superfamily)